MPTNPWSPSPSSQYLSTVLNAPAAIPSHAAPAPAAATPHTSTSTPPRPRQPSGLAPTQPQQSAFTPAQRSAQARGKPFPAASSSTGPSATRQTPHNEPESYAQRQQRAEAAAILDSQELLLWYASARNESVTQTRAFYRGVLLGVPGGYGEGGRVWAEEWERSDDVDAGKGAGRSPKGKGKGVDGGRERERERGKKRVSTG